jgi:hypothetical protein
MKKSKKKASTPPANDHKRLAHEAEGGASGAVAGAVVGAIAGPPGAIAGAILGGLAGVLAGAVLDKDATAGHQRDEELDKDIGVSGGDIGAPNLKHPPAIVGAPSGPSSGAVNDGGSTAEGPIQIPES